MQIEPNEYEQSLGNWLKTLFDFETSISYYIYDYGVRRCTICIEETNEPYPIVHTNDNSCDYLRGENSIVVAKFARENLPKGSGEWYCASKGFMIQIEKLQILKNKMTLCKNN